MPELLLNNLWPTYHDAYNVQHRCGRKFSSTSVFGMENCVKVTLAKWHTIRSTNYLTSRRYAYHANIQMEGQLVIQLVCYIRQVTLAIISTVVIPVVVV